MSLRPILETDFYRSLPDRPIGEARGGYILSYFQQGRFLKVTAEKETRSASAIIEWAFGAGDQGVTPLASREGVYLEHRISYYTRTGKFDLTLGHRPGASLSAEAALGVPQSRDTLLRCFGCHATNVNKDLSGFDAGVQCERCHPGARAHARGAGGVGNPGKLTSGASVAFCAECHRLSPPNGNPDDPVNIRFQPLRLVRSKCYQKGKLSCLTCHDAHQNARRNDPAYYRARCLTCHPGQRQKGDCLSCHMPRSSPLPHLTFTDHFIRVLLKDELGREKQRCCLARDPSKA